MGLIPDWVLAGIIAFSAAAWWFDPWRERLWGWMTDSFDVIGVDVGKFLEYDQQDRTPESDIEVRLRIRFRRSGRFKLSMRVFQCTGMGREPLHLFQSLGSISASKGQELRIPIASVGFPEPGWDNEKERGWGPRKEGSVIRGSRNVVSVQAKGWMTQSFKVFIEMVDHNKGGQKHRPSLYVQDENDNIWGVDRGAVVGNSKYVQ